MAPPVLACPGGTLCADSAPGHHCSWTPATQRRRASCTAGTCCQEGRCTSVHISAMLLRCKRLAERPLPVTVAQGRVRPSPSCRVRAASQQEALHRTPWPLRLMSPQCRLPEDSQLPLTASQYRGGCTLHACPAGGLREASQQTGALPADLCPPLQEACMRPISKILIANLRELYMRLTHKALSFLRNASVQLTHALSCRGPGQG